MASSPGSPSPTKGATAATTTHPALPTLPSSAILPGFGDPSGLLDGPATRKLAADIDALPADEPILQGYLRKEGSAAGGGAWKRRWFVLSRSGLAYYKRQGTDALQGSIPLNSISGIVVDTPAYPQPHCFQLVTAGRVYTFQAPLEAAQRHWLCAIASTIYLMRVPPASQIDRGYTSTPRGRAAAERSVPRAPAIAEPTAAVAAPPVKGAGATPSQLNPADAIAMLQRISDALAARKERRRESLLHRKANGDTLHHTAAPLSEGDDDSTAAALSSNQRQSRGRSVTFGRRQDGTPGGDSSSHPAMRAAAPAAAAASALARQPSYSGSISSVGAARSGIVRRSSSSANLSLVLPSDRDDAAAGWGAAHGGGGPSSFEQGEASLLRGHPGYLVEDYGARDVESSEAVSHSRTAARQSSGGRGSSSRKLDRTDDDRDAALLRRPRQQQQQQQQQHRDGNDADARDRLQPRYYYGDRDDGSVDEGRVVQRQPSAALDHRTGAQSSTKPSSSSASGRGTTTPAPPRRKNETAPSSAAAAAAAASFATTSSREAPHDAARRTAAPPPAPVPAPASSYGPARPRSDSGDFLATAAEQALPDYRNGGDYRRTSVSSLASVSSQLQSASAAPSAGSSRRVDRSSSRGRSQQQQQQLGGGGNLPTIDAHRGSGARPSSSIAHANAGASASTAAAAAASTSTSSGTTPLVLGPPSSRPSRHRLEFAKRWINGLGVVHPQLSMDRAARLGPLLQNGVVLCSLLTAAAAPTHVRLEGVNPKPRARAACIANIETALQVLWKAGQVRRLRIPTAEEVFDGKEERLQGLLTEVFDAYALRRARGAAGTVLRWLCGIMARYDIRPAWIDTSHFTAHGESPSPSSAASAAGAASASPALDTKSAGAAIAPWRGVWRELRDSTCLAVLAHYYGGDVSLVGPVHGVNLRALFANPSNPSARTANFRAALPVLTDLGCRFMFAEGVLCVGDADSPSLVVEEDDEVALLQLCMLHDVLSLLPPALPQLGIVNASPLSAQTEAREAAAVGLASLPQDSPLCLPAVVVGVQFADGEPWSGGAELRPHVLAATSAPPASSSTSPPDSSNSSSNGTAAVAVVVKAGLAPQHSSSAAASSSFSAHGAAAATGGYNSAGQRQQQQRDAESSLRLPSQQRDAEQSSGRWDNDAPAAAVSHGHAGAASRGNSSARAEAELGDRERASSRPRSQVELADRVRSRSRSRGGAAASPHTLAQQQRVPPPSSSLWPAAGTQQQQQQRSRGRRDGGGGGNEADVHLRADHVLAIAAMNSSSDGALPVADNTYYDRDDTAAAGEVATALRSEFTRLLGMALSRASRGSASLAHSSAARDVARKWAVGKASEWARSRGASPRTIARTLRDAEAEEDDTATAAAVAAGGGGTGVPSGGGYSSSSSSSSNYSRRASASMLSVTGEPQLPSTSQPLYDEHAHAAATAAPYPPFSLPPAPARSGSVSLSSSIGAAGAVTRGRGAGAGSGGGTTTAGRGKTPPRPPRMEDVSSHMDYYYSGSSSSTTSSSSPGDGSSGPSASTSPATAAEAAAVTSGWRMQPAGAYRLDGWPTNEDDEAALFDLPAVIPAASADALPLQQLQLQFEPQEGQLEGQLQLQSAPQHDDQGGAISSVQSATTTHAVSDWGGESSGSPISDRNAAAPARQPPVNDGLPLGMGDPHAPIASAPAGVNANAGSLSARLPVSAPTVNSTAHYQTATSTSTSTAVEAATGSSGKPTIPGDAAAPPAWVWERSRMSELDPLLPSTQRYTPAAGAGARAAVEHTPSTSSTAAAATSPPQGVHDSAVAVAHGLTRRSDSPPSPPAPEPLNFNLRSAPPSPPAPAAAAPPAAVETAPAVVEIAATGAETQRRERSSSIAETRRTLKDPHHGGEMAPAPVSVGPTAAAAAPSGAAAESGGAFATNSSAINAAAAGRAASLSGPPGRSAGSNAAVVRVDDDTDSDDDSDDGFSDDEDVQRPAPRNSSSDSSAAPAPLSAAQQQPATTLPRIFTIRTLNSGGGSSGAQQQGPFSFRIDRTRAGDATVSWSHPVALRGSPPAGVLHLSEVASVTTREGTAPVQPQCVVLLRVLPARLPVVSARLNSTAGVVLQPTSVLELAPLDASDNAVKALRAFATDLRVQHGRVQMALMAGSLSLPPVPESTAPPLAAAAAAAAAWYSEPGAAAASSGVLGRGGVAAVAAHGGAPAAAGSAQGGDLLPPRDNNVKHVVAAAHHVVIRSARPESVALASGSSGTPNFNVNAASAVDPPAAAPAAQNNPSVRRRVVLIGGPLAQLLASRGSA